MNNDLVAVLGDVSIKVGKFYDGKRKEKYQQTINRLVSTYGALEKDLAKEERYEATYTSLVKKGKELMKEGNIKENKKLEYYLRYCEAALYDFRDNIEPLNLIMKAYLMTCILFFVLSPQFFSFILPLLFTLPVFLGLKGLKKRALNGLLYAVMIVPMGIMVSVVWLKNAYLVISGNTFGEYVATLAGSYGLSVEMTNSMVVSFIGLSAVLLVSSFVTLYSAIKYRKMFI